MADSALPIPVVGKALAKTQGLSRLRLRHVLRSQFPADELPGAEREISPGAAMILWTAELLHRTQYTVDEQNAVLTELDGELYSLGCQCRNALRGGGRAASFQLVFTDGRYFTYTGRTNFIDLTTGDRVSPDARPLESIAYDLVEPFGRRYLEATVD